MVRCPMVSMAMLIANNSAPAGTHQGRGGDSDAVRAPHEQKATAHEHEAEHQAHPGQIHEPVHALELAHAADVDGKLRGRRVRTHQ